MKIHKLLSITLALLFTRRAESRAVGHNEFSVASAEKIETKGKVIDSGDNYIKIAFPALTGYKVI